MDRSYEKRLIFGFFVDWFKFDYLLTRIFNYQTAVYIGYIHAFISLCSTFPLLKNGLANRLSAWCVTLCC